MDVPEGYKICRFGCGENFPEILIEDHEAICSMNPANNNQAQQEEVINPDPYCRYCHCSYPDAIMEEHQAVCPAKNNIQERIPEPDLPEFIQPPIFNNNDNPFINQEQNPPIQILPPWIQNHNQQNLISTNQSQPRRTFRDQYGLINLVGLNQDDMLSKSMFGDIIDNAVHEKNKRVSPMEVRTTEQIREDKNKMLEFVNMIRTNRSRLCDQNFQKVLENHLNHIMTDKNNTKENEEALNEMFKKKSVFKNKEEKPKEKRNCPICLVDFENGDRVRKLPCKHMYHPECIDAWVKKTKNCPLCKEELGNVKKSFMKFNSKLHNDVTYN